MTSSKRLLGFGLGMVIALVAVTFFLADQLTTTNAAGSGPEMALTVKSGGTCDASGCTVPAGGAFTLAVELVTAPADYILAQTFIEFGSDLTYTPAAGAADEIVWPQCNSSVAVRGQLTATSVLHGCLTGLFPPLPVSNYVGNFNELSMTCSAGDSSTDVQLWEYNHAGAGTSGALYKQADQTEVIPKVSNLTITCGEGGSPGPTDTVGPTSTTGPTATTGPTSTTGPTATNTPVPPTATPTTPSTQPCGDVDGDNETTSLDALQTLWLVAGLVDSTPKDADINDDGNVTSVDAALILQIVANLYSC